MLLLLLLMLLVRRSMRPWGKTQGRGDPGGGYVHMFANISAWGPKAQEFLETRALGAERRGMRFVHSLNFVETHVASVKMQSMRKLLEVHGWRPFAVPARRTMRSDDGTSGGVVASPSISVALDDMPVVPSKADWKVQGLDWRMVPYRAKGFTYCMFTCLLA